MTSKDRVGRLQQAVNELAATNATRIEQERQEQQIAAYEKIQSATFDRASTYTSVVTGLGYAAYFTVWSFMRDDLSKLQAYVSARCISFSLIAFITFVVYQMFEHARLLVRLAGVITKTGSDFDKAQQEYEQSAMRLNRRLTPIWYVVLFLTIAPALIGAGILAGSFIAGAFAELMPAS